MTKASNVITMTYTADGEKLAKAVTGGVAKNYIAGIEYSGANLEAIYFSEGRCTPNGATAFFYEYTIKDHLGNARVNFRAGAGATLSHLENMHYYPFGMLMEGLGTGTNSPANDYAYNGKELNEDFGLNLSDYGARWYDAALGRFPGIDPLADTFNFVTPYNYAENEPVAHIDLWGMQQVVPNMTSNYLNNAAQGMKTIACEFGLTIWEGIKTVGNYAASVFPDEGTPAPDAYMKNEDYMHNGTGHEMQTYTNLKSNNTAFLSSAKGGTDKIFTDADFIFPKDAGGAWDDAASSMPIPHALNYAAKALSQTQDAQNAVDQNKVPPTTKRIDTIRVNGVDYQREFFANPAPGEPTHSTTPLNGN